MEIPKGTKWEEPTQVVKAAPGALPKKGGDKAIVTFVQDGDTTSLTRPDGSQVQCRIDQIDAPETAHPKYGKVGQPYGEEAKKTLEDLIGNKEVNLRITKAQDRFGRSLCQIEVEGKDVSLSMIQQGAAWLYRRYSNDPGLAEAESTARKNRIGLWKDPNPIYPERFKHRN